MKVYEINFNDFESNDKRLLYHEKEYTQIEFKAMINNFYDVGIKVAFMNYIDMAPESDVEEYVVRRLLQLGFKEVEPDIVVNKFSFIDEIKFEDLDCDDVYRLIDYYTSYECD